jgi:FlaA1/EpsC-like NDP-sugar epimerase
LILNTNLRRHILTLLWLISDTFIFTGSYILAYFVKVGWIFSSDLPFQTYLSATVMTAIGWIIVMITMRNYGLSRMQKSPRNFAYITYACIIGMAGFALSFYFLKQTLFSRLLLLMAGVFSAVLIYLWHIIFDQLQRKVLRKNPPTYPTLIIGTNREAENLVTKMQNAQSPLTPVAILDGRGSSKKEIAGVPVLGKLNILETVLKEKKISHLVQCDQIEHSLNLLSACKANHVTYMLLPYTLGIVDRNVPTEALEGQQVVAVEPKGAVWEWFFR